MFWVILDGPRFSSMSYIQARPPPGVRLQDRLDLPRPTARPSELTDLWCAVVEWIAGGKQKQQTKKAQHLLRPRPTAHFLERARDMYARHKATLTSQRWTVLESPQGRFAGIPSCQHSRHQSLPWCLVCSRPDRYDALK